MGHSVVLKGINGNVRNSNILRLSVGDNRQEVVGYDGAYELIATLVQTSKLMLDQSFPFLASEHCIYRAKILKSMKFWKKNPNFMHRAFRFQVSGNYLECAYAKDALAIMRGFEANGEIGEIKEHRVKHVFIYGHDDYVNSVEFLKEIDELSGARFMQRPDVVRVLKERESRIKAIRADFKSMSEEDFAKKYKARVKDKYMSLHGIIKLSSKISIKRRKPRSVVADIDGSEIELEEALA